MRGKGRKWVCSLKADGCGRHEVQNSAFPRGMRHRPEEPRGTPREVGNALRSEGREKIMSSVSELISERAGAAGLGSLLVWIDFPCVHWPLGGPHLLGTGERAGSGVSLAGRAVTS